MKWNVANSRFYGEIMEAAVKYFALDSETATEAEVHNAFEAAETVDDMRAKIKTEAEAAVKADLDAKDAKIAQLQTRITELEKSVSDQTAAASAANEQVATLTAEVAAEKLKAENAAAQVKTLAAENAKLKVGKPAGGDPPADPNLPVEENQPGAGTTIAATDFAKRLGIKN